MMLWIARNKDSRLYLYPDYPRWSSGRFDSDLSGKSYFKLKGHLSFSDKFEIDSQLFPEVTFENSPQELYQYIGY